MEASLPGWAVSPLCKERQEGVMLHTARSHKGRQESRPVSTISVSSPQPPPAEKGCCLQLPPALFLLGMQEPEAARGTAWHLRCGPCHAYHTPLAIYAGASGQSPAANIIEMPSPRSMELKAALLFCSPRLFSTARVTSEGQNIPCQAWQQWAGF